MSPDINGLPSPSSLQSDEIRGASIAGPGWQPLDLSAPPSAGLSANAVSGGGAIEFSSLSGLAWQVFSLGDFSNDFRPTSVAVDVVENDVPYFIAHADFITDRWVVDGPFMGDRTHEYATVDDHSDPAALVSPFGLHYIAIIVPQANFLQLDGLSVGILGGDEAPLPVIEYQQNGSTDAIYLQWLDSPSVLDADFDGYIVQRSPFLSLDWTDLNVQTQRSRTFVDKNVTPGTVYRYRVNTYDISGNVGYGLPLPLMTTPLANTPPVASLEVARGPHFGPVQLRFDMSGSFDPDGDPITSYVFGFGPGIEPVSQSSPVLDITLQPGNYIVQGACDTGLGSGSDYVPLIVYPQWEENPRLIEAGNEDIQRVYFPWTVTEADGSATTTFHFDGLIPGVAAITIDDQGVVSRSFSSAVTDDFPILSEPVPYGDGWAFCTVGGETALIHVWDGQQLQTLQEFVFRVDGGSCQLATDGADGLYFIYFRQDGPSDWAMVWRDLFSSVETDLLTSLTAPVDYDVDWNPQAGAFDAVYVNGEVRWTRFLPGTPIAAAAVSADVPASIEMDIDPLTGLPALVYYVPDKVFHSRLNNDLATWTAPEAVDTTSVQGPNPQLLHADGKAYIAIRLVSSGKVEVLENDGSGWSSWNVLDDDNLNDFVNLAKLPGEDGLRILTQHNDRSTRIFSIRSDDSQELFTKIAGIWGAGFELSAASSATDMHIMQRTDSGMIHLSSADGLSWTGEALPAGVPSRFVLGGAADGALRLAWTNGTDMHLDQWNGSAFVSLGGGSTPAGRRPLLSDEGPYRNAWEDLGGANFSINQSFTGTISHSMAGMPIWDGSLLGSSIVSNPLVFYGGSDFEDADIGFADIVTNKVEHVVNVNGGVMSFSWLRGRGMRGASYTDLQLLVDVGVWHVCDGPDFRPLRVIRRPDGDFEYAELPGFSNLDFGFPDLRRSCSARQTWGGAFVGLTAANLLSEHHFEWSRFGEFEELPLPQAAGMSMPELLIGPDGRWHIIYRDYLTDDLMMFSTK
ncbi:fibronectin type III domain-containing protein [bacterium]|nr:fibronectin type III domain-containing protein [bacterium]